MEQVNIVDYSDEYAIYFKSLNYEWIEKYFVIEPSDEYVLTNPQEAILDKGGLIFFAKHRDEVIGTFALIKIDDLTYELAKMAVKESFRNNGIGKMLMNKALAKAEELCLTRLILYTNTKLEQAIRMYTKYGFKVIPKNEFHNNRANLKMEKVLVQGISI